MTGSGADGATAGGLRAPAAAPEARAAAPASVLPAASLEPVAARDVARVAQTPVEPDPGQRPGEDPFVPPDPDPPPLRRPREEPRPEATEPAMPATGGEAGTTMLLGAMLLGAGIAGLALARATELAAERPR